jgi:thioredoxin 1
VTARHAADIHHRDHFDLVLNLSTQTGIALMASPNILNLNKDNFSKEVIESGSPVLVDFWAEWCGPCKMIGPILDELADEYQGKVRIGKVDIDSQQELAAQFGVRAVPTLLIFKQGQVAEQMVGARSKRDIKTSIDRVAA